MNTAIEAATKPVRILIVDDHPVVRDGLAAQLATESDFVVCGEADDVMEALDLVESTRPDLAIVDISLKSGNGIDLIKRLRARGATTRLVVWSMYPESLYAERALKAGAQGYVHKGRATTEILAALRAVLAGKVFLHDDQADRILRRMVGGGRDSERTGVDTLSDRELETFALMGRGQTTEQIAEQMHVSPKTVETYRARIKEKLRVESLPELIQRAVQWVLEKG